MQKQKKAKHLTIYMQGKMTKLVMSYIRVQMQHHSRWLIGIVTASLPRFYALRLRRYGILPVCSAVVLTQEVNQKQS